MKRILSLLVLGLFPLAAAAENRPLLVPNSQLPDEEVVEKYTTAKQVMDSQGLEREILVRGDKPGIVAKLNQLIKSGTPQEQSKAQYLARQIPQGFVASAIKTLQTPGSDLPSVQFAVMILGDAQNPKAVSALQAHYQAIQAGKIPDKDGKLKIAALNARVACKDPKAFPEMEKYASTLTGDPQIACYFNLALAGDASAKKSLVQIFNGKLSAYDVVLALEDLYTLGDPADNALVQSLIQQDQRNPHNPYTGDVYLEEDNLISSTFSLPAAQKPDGVAKFFNAKHHYVERMAIDELGHLGTPRAIELLKTRLNDPWSDIQAETIKMLRKNGMTITCKADGWNETLRAQ